MHASREPVTLTLGTTLLVGQMAICAVWADGMPTWVWAGMVVSTPIALAAYAVSSPSAAAALLPLLVVTGRGRRLHARAPRGPVGRRQRDGRWRAWR